MDEFITHSPKLGLLFEKLNFFNIYYSWWFIGLLALVAFDVIVCKLIFGKFPGLKTFKANELSSDAVPNQPFTAEWNTALSPEEASQQVQQQLRKEKFWVKSIPEPSGKILVIAAKQRLQRFGSWVSHVSILLILLANLTGALYGFREVLNIPEGTAARMQNRPWMVQCDQFRVEWYENSSTPRTFASDLRVFDQGRLAHEKTIVVNEPLQHKKVRFYQASYGPHLKHARIGFFLRDNPKKSPTVDLHLNEEARVPGTPYSLRILNFMPEFGLDENNEPISRSAHPLNPALQVQVSEHGKVIKNQWILQNYPLMAIPPIEKKDAFMLILAEYVPAFYTGLQVTYDPGADLFWTACAILVLGLMILFYLNCRKLSVSFEKDAATGRTRVVAGGASSRGKQFEEEFLRLVQELKLPAVVLPHLQEMEAQL